MQIIKYLLIVLPLLCEGGVHHIYTKKIVDGLGDKKYYRHRLYTHTCKM